MKCARPRERSVEGGSLEDLKGGHISTPHTLPDKDVEGQDEDGERSRRDNMKSKGRKDWCCL